MADLTFETRLSGQLREYADAGVRPIDRFAIAERTIARGRATRGRRWGRGRTWGLAPRRGRGVLIPLLVVLILAAVLVGTLAIGSRLRTRPPLPTPHAYVEELVAAPDLPVAMSSPTLVTLADGRVLVMGDDGAGRGTAALVYDPATGSSLPAGPMVSPDRWISSAVRLRDGRVLVIGDAVNQVFDPTTMRFAPVGPAVTLRSGATSAVLLDGRVLIAGGLPPGGNAGVDRALRSAELLDPDTLTSRPTGSIGTATGGGPMVTLPDGRVFMASADGSEIYDPATGGFSPASPTSIGGGGQPVALPDGRVVVAGSTGLDDGGKVQVWDPRSRSFSTRKLPEPLSGATLLDDGRVFLVGMCRGRSAGWTGVYDPATEVTTATPGTRACRPASTRLADGRVLIVGGLEPAVPTVEIFR